MTQVKEQNIELKKVEDRIRRQRWNTENSFIEHITFLN